MKAALVGRVGGLAVGLGVGAALTGACAATASAAPSDDGRPAISRDGSTGRSSHAPSGRASRTRETPTAASRSSAHDGGVPASAASVGPRRSSQVPAVKPAQVSGAAAPITSAPSAPAAKVAPVAPVAPVARARLGDSRGRLVTIYKGTHFAIPNRWALWVKKVSGDATFIPDSAYDLKDEDQYDWNKLAGITFTPWRPERNASIVVWRYNLQTQEFEVGPFWDVDFAYVFPTDDEVISIPVGETFDYAVDYSGITITYGDRTVFKPTPQALSPNFLTSARITGWFGGSEVAPRTVSYYLHMR